MSTSACLIVHPYTARKDIGAGHDRYAYELLNRLPSLGISPTLFESGYFTTVSQALLAEVKAVARLACMRGKERVYHATATVNAQSAITARKHPLITTVHDVLWFAVGPQYDSRIKYFLKTNAIRRAASRSDALIVPFASTRDFLVNELKTPAKRIHVVPYGVDHDQFYGLGPEEDLARPVFFPAGKVVLFVGAVNFGKGIDTLIQCFDRVVKAVPDARLVVGSGGWDTPLLRPIWKRAVSRNTSASWGSSRKDSSAPHMFMRISRHFQVGMVLVWRLLKVWHVAHQRYRDGLWTHRNSLAMLD